MTKNRTNYNPEPVYNRKYARGVIRAQVIKRNGYHNVSANMSQTFKEMRDRWNKLMEGFRSED